MSLGLSHFGSLSCTGSYNRGELVGLKLDNEGMHVREAVEIDIAANVFVDPITCIAVMPDGQIYVGGHSIYKVTAVSTFTRTR